MVSLLAKLGERLGAAFTDVAGSPVDPVLRPSQHADYQADGALALAHQLGEAPRTIAARVVDRADLDDLCSNVELSGPGFINLTVADEALNRQLTEMLADDRFGIEAPTNPDRVVVDYSAPNVAKEMHVGHLRSTFIGDAAVRLLEWLGHEVIRENHIGDWGTPFGMLIEHLLDLGETESAAESSIADLDGFYKAAREKFDGDEAFAERSRRRVVLLQGGDDETLALWRTLINASERYFLEVYDRLDLRLGADDFVGESFYND
ncbi:MAG: arginine--tRNA ligase, partial [Acidimicrobiia bacterium]|nr:arginine--tRNA ligase [Acidimicrobiia bacterium]